MVSRAGLANEDMEFIQFHPTGTQHVRTLSYTNYAFTCTCTIVHVLTLLVIRTIFTFTCLHLQVHVHVPPNFCKP